MYIFNCFSTSLCLTVPLLTFILASDYGSFINSSSSVWCMTVLQLLWLASQSSKIVFTLPVPQSPRNQRDVPFCRTWDLLWSSSNPPLQPTFLVLQQLILWSSHMPKMILPLGFCSHSLLSANDHPCKFFACPEPKFNLQIPAQILLLSGLDSFPYQKKTLPSGSS